jgi:mono/diheme cytochrome c family protein
MKQIGHLVGSISVIASLLVGDHVWAQDAGRPGLGLVLARQICSECHAIDKTQAGSPNAAAPRFETIANIPGMTGTALSATLQSPHRTMPNVMLDANELSNIVACILSLRREN